MKNAGKIPEYSNIKEKVKMAINPVAQINTASAASQVAATTAIQTQAAAPPKSTNAPIADTVQISSSASALMQEVQETAAQTAQEAGRGDRQAQRLLAKEEAARAEQQGNNKAPTLSMK